MALTNIFTRSTTQVAGITFDAQFRHEFTTKSRIPTYELENGFILQNHVIQDPSTLQMEVALGTSAFFTTDTAIDAILGVGTGALSNLNNKSLDTLVKNAIRSTLVGAVTRGGAALEALVALQVTAIIFDVDVPNVGLIPNMVITGIRHSRATETGQSDYFVVDLQQVRNNAPVDGQVFKTYVSIAEQTKFGKAAVEVV